LLWNDHDLWCHTLLLGDVYMGGSEFCQIKLVTVYQRISSNLTMYKFFSLALMMALIVPAGAAFAKSPVSASAKPTNTTIVGIVLADDGEFDVLQAAVIRAGLVDVLNGKRPYTVFAPTDQAFIDTLGVANEAAALDVIESLPLADLTDILLYHVVKGNRFSPSVLGAPKYRTVGGEFLTRAEVLDAGIRATDVRASNGVIHIIDSVLMP
jgi:uncharacterized surface protein with fasciclin (FAS1) repeats